MRASRLCTYNRKQSPLAPLLQVRHWSNTWLRDRGQFSSLVLSAFLLVGSSLVACSQQPAASTSAQEPTASTATTTSEATAAETTAAADISADLQRFEGLSNEHIAGTITYEQAPPAGGPHSPVWQNCGIYDQPVPNEQAVHSLEHGAVWITYQPDLAETGVAQLRDAVRGRSHVLLSPYPGLPAPVVASAWGLQLQLSGAADPRLAEFIAEFENGPQTPEPGAPCDGGVGEPITG